MGTLKSITVTGNVIPIEVQSIEDPRTLRVTVNFYICPGAPAKMTAEEFHQYLLSRKYRKRICRIKGMNLHYMERVVSQAVLTFLSQNRKTAADELGIKERTLYDRLKQYRREDNTSKSK